MRYAPYLMDAHKPSDECVTDILITFWHNLWLFCEQMNGNMGAVWFLLLPPPILFNSCPLSSHLWCHLYIWLQIRTNQNARILNSIKCLESVLKCPYDQILDVHGFFFYIFIHNESFQCIFPNFNLLSKLMFFGPLYSRIYGCY